MSDQPGPSRVRVFPRELAILAVGLIMLFVVLGLIVYFGAPVIGLKMCCQ